MKGVEDTENFVKSLCGAFEVWLCRIAAVGITVIYSYESDSES